MKLAGIEIEAGAIVELARRLRREGAGDSADSIETALIRGAKHVEMETIDREAILRALEGCPLELTELRAMLLADDVGEQRQAAGLTRRPGPAAPSTL